MQTAPTVFSFLIYPAFFSTSDDADDIVKNTIEALQFYAEDEALPDPSSHADIVSREDIRAELNAGAYLVSVPFIEDDSAVVRVNVTFERDILKAIDAVAKDRGLTRSSFLAQAARHEIEVGV